MKHKGFTVLEFLVVIGIMGILIGLVLTSLNMSRERSRDERRITRLQNISVALEEFAKECRAYPLTLTNATVCESNQNITFGQFLTDADATLFNQTGSEFFYQPLAYPGYSDGGCTGYHLGVQLENPNDAFASRDSNFDSNTVGGADLCLSWGNQNIQPAGFDGTQNGLYDLKR